MPQRKQKKLRRFFGTKQVKNMTFAVNKKDKKCSCASLIYLRF